MAEIVYKERLVITKGGTYTGDYKSVDGNPAVWIWTNEPVTLENMNIWATGNGIHYETGARATIRRCVINGNFQDDKSKTKGRGIYVYKPNYVIAENNVINGCGGGIFIEQTETPITKISLLRNRILNVDKRDGNLNPTSEHKAGIMLSSIKNVQDGEIAWNELVNIPGESFVEDIVNCLNSSGIEAKPIDIHNNLLDGAYPYPLTNEKFTGSGMTADGNPENNTLATATGWINFHNNTVLRCCNASMNIAAGHHVKYYDNVTIASGKFPTGQESWAFWGNMCAYDGSNVGSNVFIGNEIKNNTVGYVRKGINIPFTDRQDYVIDTKTPDYIKAMYPQNTFLPNPITKATEDAEVVKFKAKVVAAGVNIGLDVGNTNIPTTTSTSSTTTSTSTQAPKNTLRVGQSKKLNIKFVDKEGKIANPDKIATVSILSNNPGLTITAEGTLYRVVALKEGTYKIDVSVASKAGKIITKSMEVNILEALDEVVDIIFEWVEDSTS